MTDLNHASIHEEDARELARRLAGGDGGPRQVVSGQIGMAVKCPDCGSSYGPMTSEAPEHWPESIWVCCGNEIIVRTGQSKAAS